MWIVSAAEAKARDARATEEFGIPAESLMENAAQAVVDSIEEALPSGGRIAFVCGPGSNGGDGMAAARLAHRLDYPVEVIAPCPESALNPLCSEQLKRLRSIGIEPKFETPQISDCDLIVDALFGIGLSKPLTGIYEKAISAVNASGAPVISVDIPSGIHADTGEVLGNAVLANHLVTFGWPKGGLVQGEGVGHWQTWTIAEIGYPQELLEEEAEAFLLSPEWVIKTLPQRRRASYKHANGSVLIIAGSEFMAGAAVLAAMGAIRAGAGLVTVCSEPSVLQAVNTSAPEALTINRESLSSLEKYDSIVIGPGLGLNDVTKILASKVFAQGDISVCIDADAITIIAEGLPGPKGPAIFTPHSGELKRLLPDRPGDRFESVMQAAAETGKTVLLKGPFTLIAELGQATAANPTGNSGMASAGMGDVLSGVIGAFLAQGLTPCEAGAVGAYLHGLAGDLCADQIGPVGYTASDLASRLPEARAKLTRS